jgi:hypothetical protein
MRLMPETIADPIKKLTINGGLLWGRGVETNDISYVKFTYNDEILTGLEEITLVKKKSVADLK